MMTDRIFFEVVLCVVVIAGFSFLAGLLIGMGIA